MLPDTVATAAASSEARPDSPQAKVYEQPVMINPAYELIGPGTPERPAPRGAPQNGGWRRNHRRMPGDQT